jgi:hydrogenase 3 maturation protease
LIGMSLDSLLRAPRPSRVALVGVGNELNGDDGVGVRVVRDVEARLGRRGDCLFIDAGTAPENFTGPLRRFRPDLILMVDAASLDEPPGTTAVVDWQATEGFSASTHTLPPSVFARYLVEELGCRLALVGIQPVCLEFGQPLSPAVADAAGRLVADLADWLAGPA